MPPQPGPQGSLTPADWADLDARQAAGIYFRLGYTPVPLPPRSKRAVLPDWQNLHFEAEEELDKYFPGNRPQNVGILNGAPSRGLLDVDLDCPQVLVLGDRFLPVTGRESGRPSRPRSHRWYRAAGVPGRTRRFDDVGADPTRMVELLSTGSQTVVAPSIHPDPPYERYEWQVFGEPTVVEYTALLAAVQRLAAAALIARHWPPNPPPGEHGSRQDAALALSGGLARARRDERDITTFIEGVCLAAGDPDVDQRLSAVPHSVRKAAAGEHVRGWPSLAELVGDQVVSKARAWLGLTRESFEGCAPPSANGKLRPAGAAGAEGFTLGPLILRPGPPHRTPTRLLIPLAVFKGGCQVDSISLARSASGRKEAARLLAPHLGEGGPGPDEVGRVFSAIIAAAEAALDNPSGPSGPRLGDVVRGYIPQACRFTHRGERGLWSESFKAEVGRQEFLALTPSALLDAAARAADAPPTRAALLDAVVCELRVLWPDLLAATPWPASASLTPEAAAGAAAQFRSALERIWHAPRVNQRVKLEDGEVVIFQGSLVTRVNEQAKNGADVPGSQRGRSAWEMIHKPFSAWWRPGEGEGGEVVPRLAMRWELGPQIGVSLPGVSDQQSLTTIGEAYGFLDPSPKGIPRVTSWGKQRLAVLALDFTQELLEGPSPEWPEASPAEKPPTEEAEPVTPEGGCHGKTP
jgi:hypothetical protein